MDSHDGWRKQECTLCFWTIQLEIVKMVCLCYTYFITIKTKNVKGYHPSECVQLKTESTKCSQGFEGTGILKHTG